ncbi:MAG: MEMO1 family protein [Acidimicrobiales bacterium]|nr:MAG: MEMO1 family protein [Acidimicrobiales bacterium]
MRIGTGYGSDPGVRPPAVAGLFYPDDPAELRSWLEGALERARRRADGRPAPKALVAPHAGYVYSGDVAATGYALVERNAAGFRRVLLLGPSHRVPLDGLAVPRADAFATPLGVVPIDEEMKRVALGCPGVVVDDLPHAAEHSLEVHLPFLQVVLGGDWTVLPVSVGAAATADTARLIESLWGGDETLVVVSTDLSHYLDYETASERDRRTAAAILDRAPERIDPYDACGAYPLRGLLRVAREKDLPVECLDLRNSGDTAGPRDRVVGYGTFSVGSV